MLPGLRETRVFPSRGGWCGARSGPGGALVQRPARAQSLDTLCVLFGEPVVEEEAVEPPPRAIGHASWTGGIIGHTCTQVGLTEADDASLVEVSSVPWSSAPARVVEVTLGHAGRTR